MIFGRTKIQVVQQEVLSRKAPPPIFIIGCFRSGTTLLRYFLDSHCKIACPPESKFLVHLASIYNTESTMAAFNSLGYDQNYVKDRIKEFVDSFFLGYMTAHQKKRWADKTPDYVRILEFIEWLYGPNCQYIIIYRNGLDVANSMNSTYIEAIEGDNKNIYKAFEYWYHDTTIIHNWEKRYPDRCFSLHYEKLCLHTESMLKQLFSFLNEEWDENVLQWHKISHERGQEDIKARRQRKIHLSHGSFKQWDATMQNDLKSKSEQLHSLIGYDPKTLMPK